jgi:hypothetical protein
MGRKYNHTNETDSGSNSHRVSVSHTDIVNAEDIGPGSDTSSEHTKSVQLEHPVEKIEDLCESKYWHYVLRKAEADNGVEPGDRSQEAEQSVEQSFDHRVIEITDRVLGFPVTDATHGEFPIEDSAVLTMVLQRVRAAPTEGFISHLEEVPKVREKLGVDGKLDETTISAWEQELTETDKEAIEACATRVLYAVYRSGQAFPQQVWGVTIATPDTALMTKDDKTGFVDGEILNDVAHLDRS